MSWWWWYFNVYDLLTSPVLHTYYITVWITLLAGCCDVSERCAWVPTVLQHIYDWSSGMLSALYYIRIGRIVWDLIAMPLWPYQKGLHLNSGPAWLAAIWLETCTSDPRSLMSLRGRGHPGSGISSPASYDSTQPNADTLIRHVRERGLTKSSCQQQRLVADLYSKQPIFTDMSIQVRAYTQTLRTASYRSCVRSNTTYYLFSASRTHAQRDEELPCN